MHIFKWAPLLYELLCVRDVMSHPSANYVVCFCVPPLCISVSPPVRFCVPPCVFLCPPLCVSVSPPVRFCVPPLCVSVSPPFAFIIYNPTMELGGVLVPTYRNRVVIFSTGPQRTKLNLQTSRGSNG